jgi:hypothetical protein
VSPGDPLTAIMGAYRFYDSVTEAALPGPPAIEVTLPASAAVEIEWPPGGRVHLDLTRPPAEPVVLAGPRPVAYRVRVPSLWSPPPRRAGR